MTKPERRQAEERQRIEALAAAASMAATTGVPSSRNPEDDAPVQMDAAYYDEVRRAVGRGTPTVLLGTSTRSLDRSLRKLKAVQQGDLRSSSFVEPMGAAKQVLKRLLDVIVATTCLIVVAPLLVAVAVAVRLTTPGPALFRQTRLGKDRRPFVLYKFRTMYVGSSDEIHREYVTKLLTENRSPGGGQDGVFQLEDDPRITPLGRLLRRASIDELPELINVIRGDMSLVGPHPVLPWEAEMFGADYNGRSAVPPGLTGLWQVSGRNSLTMKQGLELDLEYVRRQSLALDLWILVKTVVVGLDTPGVLSPTRKSSTKPTDAAAGHAATGKHATAGRSED